jgi:hypothetical protein
LTEPVDTTGGFDVWSRAFATRVHPALVVDSDGIRDVCLKTPEEQDDAWQQYANKHFDEGFARKFYGLTEEKSRLRTDFGEGLASVGAHPQYAVISGALLCLSEGAILDLPPFSNFRNNVMWIDDHLKYSLHRAMRHFSSEEPLSLEPGLSDARLDNVTVTKARAPVHDLPRYVFGTYLPTLLYGTIMDSWITADPILKWRLSALDVEKQIAWRRAKEKQHEPPLPAAMLKTLSVGVFAQDAENRFRQTLLDHAVRRVDEVRKLWGQIRDEGRESFASCWAQGRVDDVVPDGYFASARDDMWMGLYLQRRSQGFTRLGDLPPAVLEKVYELCEDTARYVHWCLDWPRFVQIVRSIPQGAFPGDLSWTPANA